jgi:hypothetical protein
MQFTSLLSVAALATMAMAASVQVNLLVSLSNTVFSLSNSVAAIPILVVRTSSDPASSILTRTRVAHTIVVALQALVVACLSTPTEITSPVGFSFSTTT